MNTPRVIALASTACVAQAGATKLTREQPRALSRHRLAATILSLVALVAANGCAGGSGGTGAGTSPAGGSSNPPKTTTTVGIYKGTMTSTTTGQTAPVLALVGTDGLALWMSTDGRVWNGVMPASAAHFDSNMTGRMYSGSTFPDGTNAGTWMMSIDSTATQMSGHFAGSGDAGSFSLMLNSMASRPASMAAVAGVYTRSTWNGYTMTMTIDGAGRLMANDSRGCTISGTVLIPDASHNLYAIDATVSSCGSLDGGYHGQGTLLDADAMRDWMNAMHPLEQGGHRHGNMDMSGMGGMGGAGGMGPMPYNTIPTGTSNLFMFGLINGQNSIMDALAKP